MAASNKQLVTFRLVLLLCSSLGCLVAKANDVELCTSIGCLENAEKLLRNIDFDADPCQDFYQFACGRSNIRTEGRPERGDVNLFDQVAIQVEADIKFIIEDEDLFPSETRSLRRIRTFYASCMTGAQSIDRQVSEIVHEFGGFPLIGNPVSAHSDWIDLISSFRWHGIHNKAFMSIDTEQDEDNGSFIRITKVDTSNWTEELRDAEMNKYRSHLERLASSWSQQDTETQLNEMFRFRVDLARSYDLAGPDPLILQSAELMTKAPFIDWTRLLNAMIWVTVEPESTVVTLDSIGLVARLLSETKPETLINHAFMMAIEQFHTYIAGPPDQSKLSRFCRNKTVFFMRHAVTYEYSRLIVDQEDRESLFKLLNSIKYHALRMMRDVSWISQATKLEAMSKIQTMRSYVGATDNFHRQVESEDRFYPSIQLQSDEYVRNVMQLIRAGTRRKFSYCSRSKEGARCDTVNSGILDDTGSYLSDNTMTFGFGALKSLLFDSSQPNYINHARIGSIIGHEIAHAYDMANVCRDCTGNRCRWWDSESQEDYLERARCLIGQYDRIGSLDELIMEFGFQVSGEQTLSENIADNLGLIIAYSAYTEQRLRMDSPEPLLPGLQDKLNQEQLFWVNYGVLWCENKTPEEIAAKSATGVHAPKKLRLLVPLQNMPEFAEAFGCPLKSPMNPRRKCRLLD